MKVTKVISGGQTGADQAGLAVAKSLGLETGGWMPKGFRTDEGDRPDMAELYGMREHQSAEYPPRTKLNVAESDGTLVFGKLMSRGSVLTLNTCTRLNKPNFPVSWPDHGGFEYRKGDFLEWLEKNNVRVLNVAGNRERENPGVGAAVTEFLAWALRGE